MAYSIHKLPKLEKFLLLTAIASGLISLVIASFAVTTPVSLTSEAQLASQVVRSWNFTYSKENWKSYPVWNSTVSSGIWNIKIGPANNPSVVFNRQALARLAYPLKYVNIKLAIVKNTSAINPTVIPTRQSALPGDENNDEKNIDLQVLNLPVDISAESSNSASGTACTLDVMTCADGSFVSRIPPLCQFAPCPQTPYQTFVFNLYYKKLTSNTWKGPIPLTGKVSPTFQEFFFRLPETALLTLEALKIEFTQGVSAGDIVKIDYITIKNEKPAVTVTPTWYRITPTCSPRPANCPLITPVYGAPIPTTLRECYPPSGGWCRYPTPSRKPSIPWISPTYKPYPTSIACVTPPACYYGIKDPQTGNMLYCLPPFPNNWCPVRPTPSCMPRPECLDATPPCQLVMPPGGFNFCPKNTPTPVPSCVPYPGNCITWQNGRAFMTCQFFKAENWCPLPTCIPRPACLDSIPRCMIAETENMCPPTYPVPSVNPQ